MSSDRDGDPGWAPAVRLLLPFGRAPGSINGLITIRVLFLTLLNAALVMLFVMAFVVDGGVGSPDPPLVAVIVGLGLAGVAGAVLVRNRPLDGSDDSELAAAYRTSFFVGFVANEVPLLIALLLSFQKDALWPYPTGLPLYVVGMALIAPGRANLDKREEQLRQRGSTASLRRILNEPPPGVDAQT